MIPQRQVRAVFDDDTIRVYQAYPAAIAAPAVGAGTFVAPFKMERMTWIKPSFLWMMYRCGWAEKPGQERVLAIEITRTGFEEALGQAALSHVDPALHADENQWREQLQRADVRLQWDPERTPTGDRLPFRSLQLGLSGAAVHSYVNDWITAITDITGDLPAYRSGHRPLPKELPPALSQRIAADG